MAVTVSHRFLRDRSKKHLAFRGIEQLIQNQLLARDGSKFIRSIKGMDLVDGLLRPPKAAVGSSGMSLPC